MPGGDRTGPMGMGAMTGRAAGYCAGYGVPGSMQPFAGRGFQGCGRGRGGGFSGGGFGWRNRFFATGLTGRQHMRPGWGAGVYPGATPLSAEQELASLKAQAEQLQVTLENIRKRMEDLNSRGSKD